VDVVYRLFGALLVCGAVGEFLAFVVRVPAVWDPECSERLSERPPRLSKENMNRGDFMIHFLAWIFRSRFRAAVFCLLTGYWGLCFWIGSPLSFPRA
jgi:hypothetical protein